MPPTEIRCRCPSCASRHGAYANATPATAAPVRPGAELPDQGVRADEEQGVRQHEDDVVAQDRRGGTAADHAERGVPEQGVGEGEAVRAPGRTRWTATAASGSVSRMCPDQAICQACRVGSQVSCGNGVQRVAQCRPGHQHGQRDGSRGSPGRTRGSSPGRVRVPSGGSAPVHGRRWWRTPSTGREVRRAAGWWAGPASPPRRRWTPGAGTLSGPGVALSGPGVAVSSVREPARGR